MAGNASRRPAVLGLAPAPVLRGEGQWAFGHREPLNEYERIKRDDCPLNVRARIETGYARGDAARIPPADLTGRFPWWGLYPSDSPARFTLRVRVDGGQLTARQLALMAMLAHRYGSGAVELTAAQGLRLPGVRLTDVPEIWRRLDAVGLSTVQTGGDCPRPLLGGPAAGLHPDEPLDTGEQVREIARRFLGDVDLADLPHRFTSAVCWRPDVPLSGLDLVLLGADHPAHGPGYDVRVATGPAGARRLGAWVPPADAADLWLAVVQTFRDYGYRRHRARARFGVLVADWGTDRLRTVVESRIGRRLPDLPATPPPSRVPVTHLGVHRQRDGARYIGALAPSRTVPATMLRRLADTAGAYGSGRLRLARGGVLVADVPAAFAAPLATRLQSLGFGAAATRPGTEETP